MESQIIHSRTLDEHHEQDPHHVAGCHQHQEGHEDEQNHEKKSVLKKVKAKAKKIKDTIKKHANGDHDHHHDGQDIPDDDDLDEEEETVEDPETHGAPICDSAAISNADPGQVEYVAHPPGAHFGRSNAIREDPLAQRGKLDAKLCDPVGRSLPQENVLTEPPKVGFESKIAEGEGIRSPANTPVHVSPDRSVTDQQEKSSIARTDHQTKGTDPTRTFVGEEDKSEKTKVNLGRSMGLEEDPHAPTRIPGSSVSSNVATKVSEPPGAETGEVGVSPIIDCFGKMKVHDESEDKSRPDVSITETRSYQFPSAGSHDQFNPEPTDTNTNTPSSGVLKPVSEGHAHQEPMEKQGNQQSYTGKISSATAAIADKAVSAKNVLASKLGYGEKDEKKDTAVRSEGEADGDGITKSGSAMGYGKKIASTVAEKLSPVYEKVAGAGTAFMSKMPGTGTGRSRTTQEEGEIVKQDKGGSVADYLSEKLRPGEEDRALSEVISDALHKCKGEESKTQERPLGRVTESEEVARQLGTGDDTTAKKEQESYVNDPGTGVTDKLKGAMGSWFGRAEESQTSNGDQGTLKNSSEDVGEETNAAEGRRLQESSN